MGKKNRTTHDVHVTNHAEHRMKTRMGIKSKAEKQRMAELAFQRGKLVGAGKTECRDKEGLKIHLDYKGHVFIFSPEAVLITVLPAERKHSYRKRVFIERFMEKERRTDLAYA